MFVDRVAMRNQVADKLHAMQYRTRRKTQGIRRMLGGVQAALARDDRPVMFKPLADRWDRASIPKRVAGEVVTVHGELGGEG